MAPLRISVKRKKKRGRPATGQDPIIGLRLPKDETVKLDKWAKANGYTRSQAIRVMIRYFTDGEPPNIDHGSLQGADLLRFLGVDPRGLSAADIAEGVDAARGISACERVPGANKRRPQAVADWNAF